MNVSIHTYIFTSSLLHASIPTLSNAAKYIIWWQKIHVSILLSSKNSICDRHPSPIIQCERYEVMVRMLMLQYIYIYIYWVTQKPRLCTKYQIVSPGSADIVYGCLSYLASVPDIIQPSVLSYLLYQ